MHYANATRPPNRAEAPNAAPASTTTWLHSPWNAIPAALLIGTAFLHMNLGMRTIIEDGLIKALTGLTTVREVMGGVAEDAADKTK